MFIIRTKNTGYLDPNVTNLQPKFVFLVCGINLDASNLSLFKNNNLVYSKVFLLES